MSSSLYWRPLNTQGECFGRDLKYSLAPMLWEHDGSLSSDWTLVGRDLIPFLRGVASAGRNEVAREAEELIELIEKYEEVEISLIS